MWDADNPTAGCHLSAFRFSEGASGFVCDLLRLATMAALADRAILAKRDRGGYVLLGGMSLLDPDEATTPRTPCEERASPAILDHVASTGSPCHVQHPFSEPWLVGDRYLLETRPASVLCVPLIRRKQVVALLYLERRTSREAFTAHQRQLVSLLGTQAVITTGIVDYYIGEMKALEAKVNPQFIHNTLSVVAELVVSDSRKAEQALVMLSRLYRYVLASPMDRIVSLSQELAICRDYLALEQHRLGDRMKSDITVSGPVDLIHIPALILQPLVENGVRHGIARKVGGGHLHVEVTVTEKTCRLRVSDDGPGWDERGERAGFGLRCVRERLALFYPGTHTFAITKGAGVSAEVTIPREASASRSATGKDDDSRNETRNQSLKGQATMATTSYTVTVEVPGDNRIKLLSFIFRLYTDRNFQAKFREDTEAAMDDFALDYTQRVAVHHSGLDPAYVNADGVARNADWWRKYALYKNGKGEKPRSDDYDDTGADPSRMACLAELLIDELCNKEKFEEAW
jgi:hypothetical protein